jgi:hypothetical protein
MGRSDCRKASGENEVMNALRRSQWSVEPGSKSCEGNDSYPDASMPKFSGNSRGPIEIAIDLAIDAAVITALVATVLLANTPWLMG